MIKKDSTYWARTFANTLANEVSTCVALSDLTFEAIAEKAGITNADVRAIRNLDVELPMGVWLRYVLAASPGAVRAYVQETPGATSFEITDELHEASRDWLVALATRMKSAIDESSAGDPALVDAFDLLLQQGDRASFKEWAILAMDLGVGHGLDASHLKIVPQDTTDAIQAIWDESLR